MRKSMENLENFNFVVKGEALVMGHTQYLLYRRMAECKCLLLNRRTAECK